jgi:hypothetical protein
MSGGMILATLQKSRHVEYLRQHPPLYRKTDGGSELALSLRQIRESSLLVAVDTHVYMPTAAIGELFAERA